MPLPRLVRATLGVVAAFALSTAADAATHHRHRHHAAHVQTATYRMPAHRFHARHAHAHRHGHTRLAQDATRPRHHANLRGS